MSIIKTYYIEFKKNTQKSRKNEGMFKNMYYYYNFMNKTCLKL